jgi:hypothetical protein
LVGSFMYILGGEPEAGSLWTDDLYFLHLGSLRFGRYRSVSMPPIGKSGLRAVYVHGARKILLCQDTRIGAH